MVFCNKCGKENNDSTKFCTGCGNNLLTSIQPVHQHENMPLKEMASNGFLCPQCGKQNKENAKFCIVCGNSLTLSVPPVLLQVDIPITEISSNELLCTKCGKQNKESAKFCIVCGNRLSPSLQESMQQQTNIGIQEQVINNENDIGQITMPAELNTTNSENIKDEEDYVDKYNNQTEKSTPELIPIIEEDYTTKPKKKRKKIIFWVIGILVVVSGIGAFFLFGNTSGINKDTSTSTIQQDIQSKEETQTDIVNIPQRKDSATPKANDVDSTITISPEIITVKPADSVIRPPLINTNKAVPIETPAAPTLQMAINDLTKSKDFTKNAKILSYTISKLNMQQCNAVITFKLENSDVKYTATLTYKNIGGNYIYESNTGPVKEISVKEKNLSTPPSSTEYNVKNDLMDYLRGQKTFAGIQYTDISDVIITKVGDRTFYEEYGNTSYQVELTIKNMNRKCQVIYTGDGKLFVKSL